MITSRTVAVWLLTMCAVGAAMWVGLFYTFLWIVGGV